VSYVQEYDSRPDYQRVDRPSGKQKKTENAAKSEFSVCEEIKQDVGEANQGRTYV
jgi:hypothetical protein